MVILKTWLVEFRDGFLASWGLIFLFVLLIRFLNNFLNVINDEYTHPSLETTLTIASWLGVLFATTRTLYIRVQKSNKTP